MSSKFNLISDLENPKSTLKQKYQVFEVEMGFEKVSVLVPLEVANDFMQEANTVQPKSTASLSELVIKYQGILE